VGELSGKAAGELGLVAGTAVAASLIDAYSGALGTLGVALDGASLDSRLALIAGTSSCHITVSVEPPFVPGVWGPYFSVLLPGLWANEAGQSATGALIDRVIDGHGAAADARKTATEKDISLFELLDQRLDAMAGGEDPALLTHGRHVQPDFHGNRSPIADPLRKGAIVGLSLDRGIDDLALDYLATLQALAYSSRHILFEMRAHGVTVETLVVSGGLAQNRLFLRQHADATGCTIVVPDQREPVLLGSAMLGAVAAGHYADLPTAMQAMSGSGTVMEPARGAIAAYHDRKYKVFRRMQEDFTAYAELMAD
jgi:FGGY-family pentulose kinase